VGSSLALQIMCVIVGTFFCFGWFFGALADSSDYVCGGDFSFLVGVKWWWALQIMWIMSGILLLYSIIMLLLS
jgi:hypothetical protein